MVRVGVIGVGRIGSPVVDFLSETAAYELACVLQRSDRAPSAPKSVRTIDAFLDQGPDLILELASPKALAAHGAACLAVADVWTVNGAALADPDLAVSLSAASVRSGRRLRLLPGAIAGLDGAAAIFRDPRASLKIIIQRPDLGETAGVLFVGSARGAARAFPHETNVAVAAALAGPGLDATVVEIVSASTGGQHRLILEASGQGGQVRCSVELRPDTFAQRHPVAASVIAALDRETRAIWAG